MKEGRYSFRPLKLILEFLISNDFSIKFSLELTLWVTSDKNGIAVYIEENLSI